jgi:acyl carrier protein
LLRRCSSRGEHCVNATERPALRGGQPGQDEVFRDAEAAENPAVFRDELHACLRNGMTRSFFARHLARRLPGYAHPVFIRLKTGLDATETFKQKKHQLVAMASTRETSTIGFSSAIWRPPPIARSTRLLLRASSRQDQALSRPSRQLGASQHRVYHGRQKMAPGGVFSVCELWSKPAICEKWVQSMSVRLRIISAMKQIAEQQPVALPPLDDNLSLHGTGFDSLAFATLVARLEYDLGIDPFTISEDAAFPLTVGDFVQIYEDVPA